MAFGLLLACSPDTANEDYCDVESPCVAEGTVCDIVTHTCESSSQADAGDGADAAAVCDDGNHECLAIPVDWTGPVVKHQAEIAEDLPRCGAAYSEELATLGTDLVTSDSCGCACGEVADVACGSALVVRSNAANCTALSSFPTALLNGSSQRLPIGITPINIRGSFLSTFTNPTVLGGTCSPPTATGTVASSFGSQVRICAAQTNQTSCDAGETCAPSFPSQSAQCITREGDFDCPDSTYTEKTLLFATIVDERNCDTASCSCELPSTCGGSIAAITDDNPPAFITDSSAGCMSVNGSADLYVYAPDSDLACGQSGNGEVTGSVLPQEATTLCCQPE